MSLSPVVLIDNQCLKKLQSSGTSLRFQSTQLANLHHHQSAPDSLLNAHRRPWSSNLYHTHQSTQTHPEDKWVQRRQRLRLRNVSTQARQPMSASWSEIDNSKCILNNQSYGTYHIKIRKLSHSSRHLATVFGVNMEPSTVPETLLDGWGKHSVDNAWAE